MMVNQSIQVILHPSTATAMAHTSNALEIYQWIFKQHSFLINIGQYIIMFHSITLIKLEYMINKVDTLISELYNRVF